MKLHQLSLFMENKPGALSRPCKVLADAGINILTMSLADTQQFGILRLIVRDWQKAKMALEESGAVVNVTEVLAIEVEDRPGGLAKVVGAVEDAGLNVEYTYAFTCGCNGRAILVFRFENPDEAVAKLQAVGVNVIGSVDLYSRIEQ
jgi:hypothetical protein